MPKIPENNGTEERFILAHGFRGFSPKSLGPSPLAELVWELVEEGLLTSWKTGGDRGPGRTFQDTPQWLLPPATLSQIQMAREPLQDSTWGTSSKMEDKWEQRWGATRGKEHQLAPVSFFHFQLCLCGVTSAFSSWFLSADCWVLIGWVLLWFYWLKHQLNGQAQDCRTFLQWGSYSEFYFSQLNKFCLWNCPKPNILPF